MFRAAQPLVSQHLVMGLRKRADEFYDAIQKPGLSEDERRVQRQALAGMLWTKQFYYYNIEQWLDGDPGLPPVPESRHAGRNHEWEHLNNFDIISMPDKWEYPWYAALELAKDNPVYQDSASKFFEHFLPIARATTGAYRDGKSLWDEEDGFFYDVLHLPDGSIVPLKVRSLVGLMPLLAVETIEHDLIERLPDFKRRLNWFFNNRAYLRDSDDVACVKAEGENARRLLAVVNRDRLVRVLKPMLDPNEFLSEYGIRSVSKFHRESPYRFHIDGQTHTISYQPAEYESGLFGGNSNWRGPIIKMKQGDDAQLLRKRLI